MDKALISQKLGANIQHLRKRAGLTQDQLAERINRSQDAISNIERGTSAPPPDTALAIANALQVDLTDLYDLNLTGRPVPQDTKDFLRALKASLVERSPQQRHNLYALFNQILDLVPND